jgi:uncharacterized surface protein with fasciclin (FAS1) repeats
MKTKLFRISTIMVVLGLTTLFFTSCEKDEITQLEPNTVVEIVLNSATHNTLEAALVAANLTQTLSGVGPFTVFAPTDAAFAALPAGTLTELLNDPNGELTDILKYHVVAGKALSSDLSNNQELITLLGKNVTVTINSSGVFINDAKVTIANVVAKNGVVHIIDAVLIPAEETPATVVDIVVNSPSHNTLEAAVIAANLAGALSGVGPFTVFAPTDAAFNALPAGTLTNLLADPSGKLTDILKFHVVAAKALSTDLTDGQQITTLLGDKLTVVKNSNGVFINGAKVTVADVEAGNGVVHVIDAVLIPTPETVVNIIVDSESHSTLEAAVIAAELVDALSSQGPFTVFAPVDAAFNALPEGTLDALLADPSGKLTDILKYHVVAAKALSTDLTNGQEITTLLGDKLTVTINANGVFINDAKVIMADLKAKNGVVHVIDAVLIPTPETVVNIIVDSESHSTLEAAVIAAELVDALSSQGPFTVFAPVDAAFDALPEGTLEALLADPSGDLTNILKYHVVAAKALSGSLTNGQEITTLLGEKLTVTINSNGVFINNAKVIAADIMAKNGVVHVIDAVLLPPAKK